MTIKHVITVFLTFIISYGYSQNSSHLTMGNPSGAVSDTSYPNNYLITKKEFVLSYNRSKGIPNWVSWHLDSTWIGEAQRQNNFRTDTTLPGNWYRVSQNDYRNSGFDRGHVCPSADRTSCTENNSNTFLMTNMIPQAPRNNRVTWAKFETYCRSLISEGHELYIIAGGYGSGGSGANGYACFIRDSIMVPSNTWKVVMVLEAGENDLARVNANTCIIALDIPNTQEISSDWTEYRTSVDEIEAKTGYDFFNLLPDDVENVIEKLKYCP